jgi:hypothetical protein
MSKARIPSEITDTVIDYLHSDTKALAACTRVCKEWLPASRYHLFSTISVHKYNFTRFFDTLDTPDCIWRPYVRHLHLTESQTRGREFEFTHLDDASLLKLSTLKAVNELSLQNFRYADLAKLSSAFGGVTALNIRHCYFSSLAGCMSMVTLFPLKQLTLEDNIIYYKELPVTPPGSLCVIHLRSLFCREILTVGQLLRDVGPSLTHLYLSHPHFLRRYPYSGACQCLFMHLSGINHSPNHLGIRLDLGHNTNLRCVHFGIKLNQRRCLYVRTLAWLPIVVSQIHSPQMEELVFGIEVDFLRDLNKINWNLWANIFAQPQFCGLKKLHFNVLRVGYLNPSRAGAWIRRELPACEARGILSIHDMCPVRVKSIKRMVGDPMNYCRCRTISDAFHILGRAESVVMDLGHNEPCDARIRTLPPPHLRPDITSAQARNISRVEKRHGMHVHSCSARP